MPKREGNPIWYGMKLYWDQEWDYSFWYALGWHEFKFTDDRPGVILSPEEDYPLNSLSVQPRDLGMEVTKEDMTALTEGFVAGLMSLPDCKIESQEESVVGSLLSFDARFTFREGDAMRKRWVRLLYRGTRQYLLTGQGADPDEFEYWLPMFFIPIDTFVIGPRLDMPGGWPPPFYRKEEEVPLEVQTAPEATTVESEKTTAEAGASKAEGEARKGEGKKRIGKRKKKG